MKSQKERKKELIDRIKGRGNENAIHQTFYLSLSLSLFLSLSLSHTRTFSSMEWKEKKKEGKIIKEEKRRMEKRAVGDR